MRTELIPAADVRIGDCVLESMEHRRWWRRPAGKGSAGEWCRSRCPPTRAAGSSRGQSWWPVPCSSG